MAMSELDQKRHASLELLRPICTSLMKDASKDRIKGLREALNHVDDNIAQEIQQFILFPIQTRLRLKDLSEGTLCELCEVVVVVFQKTEAATLGAFFDTFNPLMFTLTPKDGSTRVAFEFEETKTALIKALTQLLKATQEIILCKVYCTNYVPALGQLVAVLLSFAEIEKSRTVQKLALDCLFVVLQMDRKFGKKYRPQLAALFPFCLPGITMATCRIATGDPKQGHSVIVKAMEVFVTVITLVMEDGSLEKVEPHAGAAATEQQLRQPAQHAPSPRAAMCVDRTEEWVKATGSKVKVLVERICKLVSHDNWRVRLGLTGVCEQLLASCCRSLSESLPKILETLVGLINDPYGNVARKALNALQAFSTAAAETQGDESSGARVRTLVEILEENLYGLASSLPRQIRMCDEDEKPALIRLLNGYITLLGPNMSCVMNSAPHLSRLCLALVQALELDTHDLHIVEERGTTLDRDPEKFEDEFSSKIWKPRKHFKHFRDELILQELLLICRQLGKYGNIHTLVDHLLDVSQSSSSYHLAATLVINEMVMGAGRLDESVPQNTTKDGPMSHNTELLPDVISLLMDEYLSPRNLKLLDSITESHAASASAPSLSSALLVVGADEAAQSRLNLVNRNRAILQICLHMEGLAKFAKVLGPERQEHLIRSLYPLVENFGHENLHISSTAHAALMEFAEASGHRTLDSLLRQNADYLVSSVSMRLRHFHLNRRTPQTLCVMLRCCSKELLPHVRRSVTQLLDSLDDNYTEDLVLFMPVLLELVRAIARWFPFQEDHPSSLDQDGELASTELQRSGIEANSALDPQKLVDFLVDYLETKRAAEENFSDEGFKEKMTLEDIEREMTSRAKGQEQEIPEEEEEEPEKEKETPSHIMVVKEVFQRMRNILSANDGRLRVQALDVVTQGFQCLWGHERELLPQAHQMWAGLRPLFQSQEKFVVVKAVRCLLDLSKAAGDFLRQRTMKEIVPALAAFMDKQAKISQECHSGYLHTANHKLQLCILSTAGPLARNLKLDRNHLDQVARLCLPYLSELQPDSLQQASVESFEHFISLDGDAMWLLLSQVYVPWCLEPPGPEFTPVRMPTAAMKKNNFTSNVTELFKRHYNDESLLRDAHPPVLS